MREQSTLGCFSAAYEATPAGSISEVGVATCMGRITKQIGHSMVSSAVAENLGGGPGRGASGGGGG